MFFFSQNRFSQYIKQISLLPYAEKTCDRNTDKYESEN